MTMDTKKLVAVLAIIRPGAAYTYRQDETRREYDLEWQDTSPAPTAEELADGEKQLDALAYRDKRAAEYPPLGDQLDALWSGGQAATDMKAEITAVKSKYPKP